MIRQIVIRNIALIERIECDLHNGFTVFTGETGAGKSILVGAIGLLVGERASSELIRAGADEAEVIGVFEAPAVSAPLAGLLNEMAISCEDNALIIRRIVSREGRNRVFVNQVPAPLGALKKIGDLLVDLHGQHEHQSLLNPRTPRLLVDSFPAVAPVRAAYEAAFGRYTGARAALEAHEKKARELAARRDVLEFQYRELREMELRRGEEQELEQRTALLSSTADRIRHVSEIHALLTDETAGAVRSIAKIRGICGRLARLDPSVASWNSDLENVDVLLSELETFCGRYLETADDAVDPGRIEHLNSRLAKIQRLKKKYLCPFEGLLGMQERLRRDLDALENVEADGALLKKQCDETLAACRNRGEELGATRRRESARFDSRVSAMLSRLGFPGGEWATRFTPLKEPSAHGMEEIGFHVRTNPGEPLLPLAKSASGGEISRLMLAVKTVLAEQDRTAVLIFDEIDAGIGGMIAGEVAEALYALSRSHQVLCISHLHQIASRADNHLHVFKQESGSRIVTGLRELTGPEKVDEIARMLGSDTTISKKHAKEILRHGGGGN